MPATVATTLIAADAWSRWLLATMDDHLAEAAFDGMPFDILADCVEEGLHRVPVLVDGREDA